MKLTIEQLKRMVREAVEAKIPAKGGDEADDLSRKAKKVHSRKAGERSKSKEKYRARKRQVDKKDTKDLQDESLLRDDWIEPEGFESNDIY